MVVKTCTPALTSRKKVSLASRFLSLRQMLAGGMEGQSGRASTAPVRGAWHNRAAGPVSQQACTGKTHPRACMPQESWARHIAGAMPPSPASRPQAELISRPTPGGGGSSSSLRIQCREAKGTPVERPSTAPGVVSGHPVAWQDALPVAPVGTPVLFAGHTGVRERGREAGPTRGQRGVQQ